MCYSQYDSHVFLDTQTLQVMVIVFNFWGGVQVWIQTL